MATYYEVLGIKHDASTAEVMAAYNDKVQKVDKFVYCSYLLVCCLAADSRSIHFQADPSKQEGERALEQYGLAYQTLSDAHARQQYDKEILAKLKSDTPQTAGQAISKAAVDSKGAAIDLKNAIQSDNPEDRAHLIGKAVTALGQSLGQGKL